MRSINPNLFPHDGYWFQDSDGARIFGDSWAGVVARVVSYRTRANLPPGDVRAEVMAQACGRNPGLCVESDPVNAAELKKASLKSRVLKWLNEGRTTKPEHRPPFVSWNEVHRRRDICVTCMKNQALPGGCASCTAAVTEARKVLVGDRPIDKRLNACSVLGEDVAVSGYFELVAVDNSELPAQCWRKRTI